LLICIHIAINPSISPAYTNMYTANNNLQDIHPGMRFIKILEVVRKRYRTIEMALDSNNLYNEIISELQWKSDLDNYLDFNKIYGDLFSKLEIIEESGKKIDNTIDGEKIYDIDFLIFKFYKFSKIKSKHSCFFMDMSSYLSDAELIQTYAEIDNKIHCPIIFSEALKKYQLNVSGMTFSSPNENGGLSIVINLKKDKDDESLQIEFLNYILIPIYFELDKQLLYSDDKLDFSLVDIFDIDDGTKKFIIELYKKRRKMK